MFAVRAKVDGRQRLAVREDTFSLAPPGSARPFLTGPRRPARPCLEQPHRGSPEQGLSQSVGHQFAGATHLACHLCGHLKDPRRLTDVLGPVQGGIDGLPEITPKSVRRPRDLVRNQTPNHLENVPSPFPGQPA